MMTSVLLGKVVVRLLIARDNTEGWDRNSSSSKAAPTLMKETKMVAFINVSFEVSFIHS